MSIAKGEIGWAGYEISEWDETKLMLRISDTTGDSYSVAATPDELVSFAKDLIAKVERGKIGYRGHWLVFDDDPEESS